MRLSHLRVRWHRIFGVYLLLAGVCVAGSFFEIPLAQVWRIIGMGMLLAFVPLVMSIYFLRGLLRIT